MPFVDIGKTLQTYAQPLRELAEALEEAGRFMVHWERRALWFLLAQFGVHSLRCLATLDDEAGVEEAMLHALEAVVADGEVVPALRAAVANAPHLGNSQRTHLVSMDA